jgi:cell division protein DivIC
MSIKRDTRKKSSKHHGTGSPSALRVVLILFFLILIAVGATLYVDQNAQFARVAAKADTLSDQAAAAEQGKDEALSQQAQIGSDEYIEDVARDQLGMVKTGETVFKSQG